ncbi:MAG: hypothetical protein K0R65_1198 [Crocinitomicaceae bacterium]|jgi:predicted membrane-bound spermidine synthase|nr:hypothetical protein [Crocinitomicaceae bacterium]
MNKKTENKNRIKQKPEAVKAPDLLAPDTRTILLIALIEGFSLIFVEILSAKILNAYFGSSMKVWTVVLSLTLLFLALGYFYGGKLANENRLRNLSRVLAFSSIAVCLTLIFSNALFGIVAGMEFFTALIITAIFLLGPQLFLFGCISPLLVRLFNDKQEDVVYSSGRVYFVSTAGGILGALLLGYFLLDAFGITINYILVSLLLYGALYSLYGKITKTGGILLGFLIFINLISYNRINQKNEGGMTVVYESEGVMGQIKVIDTRLDAKFSLRSLAINGIHQSKIMNIPEAYTFWNYPHLINFFARIKPAESQTLVLGLGGGSVVKELNSKFPDIDVVELDKRIITVANEYFYLSSNKLKFFNDDARTYLRKCRKKYDLVVYDLLTGETQPNYVFTREALTEMKKRLNKDALVIVNYQGIVEGEGDLAFRTLYKTFREAGFTVNFKSKEQHRFGDIVFVLSHGNPDYSKVKLADLNECCRRAKNMQDIEQKNISNFVPDLTGIEVLTDDKPRLELLNSNAIYEWRHSMRQAVSNQMLGLGQSLFR